MSLKITPSFSSWEILEIVCRSNYLSKKDLAKSAPTSKWFHRTVRNINNGEHSALHRLVILKIQEQNQSVSPLIRIDEDLSKNIDNYCSRICCCWGVIMELQKILYQEGFPVSAKFELVCRISRAMYGAERYELIAEAGWINLNTGSSYWKERMASLLSQSLKEGERDKAYFAFFREFVSISEKFNLFPVEKDLKKLLVDASCDKNTFDFFLGKVLDKGVLSNTDLVEICQEAISLHRIISLKTFCRLIKSGVFETVEDFSLILQIAARFGQHEVFIFFWQEAKNRKLLFSADFLFETLTFHRTSDVCDPDQQFGVNSQYVCEVVCLILWDEIVSQNFSCERDFLNEIYNTCLCYGFDKLFSKVLSKAKEKGPIKIGGIFSGIGKIFDKISRYKDPKKGEALIQLLRQEAENLGHIVKVNDVKAECKVNEKNILHIGLLSLIESRQIRPPEVLETPHQRAGSSSTGFFDRMIANGKKIVIAIRNFLVRCFQGVRGYFL